MRINRFIAASGLTSRRKAEELILSGKIYVNGKKMRELSYRVTDSDLVEFEGKEIKIKDKKSYIYNKPYGYLCSHKDPFHDKTIYDQLPPDEGLFSVGRLDLNSEGLLIITNDGDLGQKIAHPSSETEKEYIVALNRQLKEDDRRKILSGLSFKGIFYKADDIKDYIFDEEDKKIIADWPDKNTKFFYRIVLHEGKKREIRNIFKSLSYKVIRLIRIRIGDLVLKDLPPSAYRLLSQEEDSN